MSAFVETDARRTTDAAAAAADRRRPGPSVGPPWLQHVSTISLIEKAS